MHSTSLCSLRNSGNSSGCAVRPMEVTLLVDTDASTSRLL